MNNNGIERSIGRLEGEIKQLISEVSELKMAFTNLELGRLSTLEKDFANLTGKLSIIAAVVSVVISSVFVFIQSMIK